MHKGIKKSANTQMYLRVCALFFGGGLLRRELLVLQDSTFFIYL